jgi:Zn-dependent peptidase ImmA (M78 family)
MTDLERLAPQEVGARLRMARESANITQSAAAEALGVARTTIVAMEQGQRRVRISELQKLAHTYRTSVNALLRRESIHVDLVPRFRKLNAGHADALSAAQNLVGVTRVRNFPPERPLLSGDVRAQAEQDADELRQRMGLGMSPIPHLITLLEMELGVRVYMRRLDGRISGVFVYDESIGACMLLNANHPHERRVQTAAHEAGHLVAARREPEILHTSGQSNSREERYADAFARALLTPARGVLQKFREVAAGSKVLTRRHVIVLAHFFGVSREAMVRRLEELGSTRAGTWEWFQANGGITDDHAREVLGDLARPDVAKAEADRPTTLRLNLLAAEAERLGLMSEGQLARLLRIDRTELREFLTDDELDRGEPDGTDDRT